MNKIGFSIIIFAILTSGCASKTSPYGASISNVEKIKATNINPVAVASFQSYRPGLASIICRGVAPVTVAPNFESYIEKAFIDELKLAGAYNPISDITLFGKLEEIDFSSGITDGNWRFSLRLSNNKNQSFTTNSIYEFSGSYIGDKACQEVAQAFGQAVQKLIGDIVRSPDFKQMAK